MFHWPKPSAALSDNLLVECVVFDDNELPARKSRKALSQFLRPLVRKAHPPMDAQPDAI
jgi:hypothetical protein